MSDDNTMPQEGQEGQGGAPVAQEPSTPADGGENSPEQPAA